MRDVAFSCDDAGSPFLKVAVWSLLDRYRGSEPLRINVFEGFGGHSQAHKDELAAIVAKFPAATLRYVNVEPFLEPYPDIVAGRAASRWNVFTWTPIFTPQILADATGNVIHFDIDMLFNADVSPLFALDLSRSPDGRPYVAACCHEYDVFGSEAGRVVWEKGILPRSVERYFNTGVLVMNAEACRAERTWERIVEWYRAHVDIADRIEQDAWNALYADRVLPLHVKWNFHDRNIKGYARRPLSEKYWLGNPPRECLEASVAPCILHFWGPKKPWKVSHRPYRRLYHEAMAAVGLKPPREPLLAPYHAFIDACRMESIRDALKLPAEMYSRIPANGKVVDRAAITRSKVVRRALRSVRHAVAFPFWFAGAALAAAILPALPRRAMQAFCDFAAAAMYALDRKGRRLALANLHVLQGRAAGLEGTWRFDPSKADFSPTRRERAILKGSYRTAARAVGHAFWTMRGAEAKVREAGELSAECKEVLRLHKPAVTVSAHAGCWEILSQIAHLEGHSMMSVAKPLGPAAAMRLLVRARRSIGQEIVAADGAFKPLMAGLKAGKSIGLLVDQRVAPEHGGVWVRFCGRPVPVSAAPAFFAAKAKVHVLVAWSRPLADGRYRCELVDDIPPEEARDVWAATQRCASAIERTVRRHPSRWILNYNLFGTFPMKSDLEALEARERKYAAAEGVK